MIHSYFIDYFPHTFLLLQGFSTGLSGPGLLPPSTPRCGEAAKKGTGGPGECREAAGQKHCQVEGASKYTVVVT